MILNKDYLNFQAFRKNFKAVWKRLCLKIKFYSTLLNLSINNTHLKKLILKTNKKNKLLTKIHKKKVKLFTEI